MPSKVLAPRFQGDYSKYVPQVGTPDVLQGEDLGWMEKILFGDT